MKIILKIIVIGFLYISPFILKAQTYKDSLEVFQLSAFFNRYRDVYFIHYHPQKPELCWDFENYFNMDSVESYIKQQEKTMPWVFTLLPDTVAKVMGISKNYFIEKYITPFPYDKLRWFVADSSNDWIWFRRRMLNNFDISYDYLTYFKMSSDTAIVAWKEGQIFNAAPSFGRKIFKPFDFEFQNHFYKFEKKNGIWYYYEWRWGYSIRAYLKRGKLIIEKLEKKKIEDYKK